MGSIMELYSIVGRSANGSYFTPFLEGREISPTTDLAKIHAWAIEYKTKYPNNDYFIMSVTGKVVEYTPPVTPKYIIESIDSLEN